MISITALQRTGHASDGFGGEITAANRAFHGGGPASCGPIPGKKKAKDTRLLRGTPTVDAGLRGKCGRGFLDDCGLEKVCFAGGKESVMGRSTIPSRRSRWRHVSSMRG